MNIPDEDIIDVLDDHGIFVKDNIIYWVYYQTAEAIKLDDLDDYNSRKFLKQLSVQMLRSTFNDIDVVKLLNI